MKAVVYTNPFEMQFREEVHPVINEGDVLIKVEAVGICGSDMHAYHGHDSRRQPPLILGHEVCGKALMGKYQGRRVVVDPLITCGVCSYCKSGRTNLCPDRELIGMNRPGAFAELIAMPEKNLIPIPDHLSSQMAALAEPLATALHGIKLAGERTNRDRALVIGGGSIGILSALLLARQGVDDIYIAETNDNRSATANKLGIATVFNPLTEDLPKPSQIPLVVDAVGYSQTRAMAVKAVAPGGAIVHIGLGAATGDFDFRTLTLQEVAFYGAYTYTHQDVKEAVAILASGEINCDNWLEERSLEQGPQAFADLDKGCSAAAKIILNP